MTELFNRAGTSHTASFVDAKGVPHRSFLKPCSRCGGLGGGNQWKFTGWTCFDCGGAGNRGTATEKLFTAEQLAKLNATAAKKAAAKTAKLAAALTEAEAAKAGLVEAFKSAHPAVFAKLVERAEADAFAASLLSQVERKGMLSEKQIAAVEAGIARDAERAAKVAASTHVGTVGERFTATVTVERINSFESQFGTVHIVAMRTAEGHALVSKGRFHAEKGEMLTIKATVKEHGEFRGEAQTIVQRVAA
jgi:hypothetical protein